MPKVSCRRMPEGSTVAVPVVSEILHYFFKVPMPPGNPYQRLQVGD